MSSFAFQIENILLLLGSDTIAKANLKILLSYQNAHILDFPFQEVLSPEKIVQFWNLIQKNKQTSLGIVIDYQKISLSHQQKQLNNHEENLDKLSQLDFYLQKMLEKIQDSIINLQELMDDEVILLILVDENKKVENKIENIQQIQQCLNYIYWKMADKRNTQYLKFLFYLMENIPKCFYINQSHSPKDKDSIIQTIYDQSIPKENALLKIPNEILNQQIEQMQKSARLSDYYQVQMSLKDIEQLTDKNTFKKCLLQLISLLDSQSEGFNHLIKSIKEDLNTYQNIGLKKLKEYLDLQQLISIFYQSESYTRGTIIQKIKEVLENEIKGIKEQNEFPLNNKQIQILLEYSTVSQECQFIQVELKSFEENNNNQLISKIIQSLYELEENNLRKGLKDLEKMQEQENQISIQDKVKKIEIKNFIQEKLGFIKDELIDNDLESQIKKLIKLDQLSNNLSLASKIARIFQLLISHKLSVGLIGLDQTLIREISNITQEFEKKKLDLKDLFDENLNRLDKQILNIQLKFYENEGLLTNIYSQLQDREEYQIHKHRQVNINNILYKLKDEMNPEKDYETFINNYFILERAEKIIKSQEQTDYALRQLTQYKDTLLGKLKEKDLKQASTIKDQIQHILVISKKFKINFPKAFKFIIEDLEKQAFQK